MPDADESKLLRAECERYGIEFFRHGEEESFWRIGNYEIGKHVIELLEKLGFEVNVIEPDEDED